MGDFLYNSSRPPHLLALFFRKQVSVWIVDDKVNVKGAALNDLLKRVSHLSAQANE
jgi:hypothetical protein